MRSIVEKLAYNRKYSSQLNPLLFEDEKLKPQIRERILQIVDAFLEYAEVSIKISDIRLIGSNASYNYNEHSDLDIHIVTDLSKIAEPETIARLYFDSVKKNFKDSYDIKIKGIDVEIYVEDINTTSVSNGIYSVSQDEWIKEPVIIEDPTDSAIEKAEQIEEEILDNLEDADSVEELEDIINNLYLLRKDALTAQGESGPGNLAFKSIRNKGILDKVKAIIRNAETKKLSLESKKIREASAGDIKLKKMIYCYAPSIDIKKYPEIVKFYDKTLKGYYIEWEYTYNKITRDTDDRNLPHSDKIDSLPSDIRRIYKGELGIWGRFDYYSYDNSIKPFITDNPGIPSTIYNAVKKRFFNNTPRIRESTSLLKTLKGSIIKRSSKYGVGKEIGGQIYFHKDYVNEICPELHDIAKAILEEEYPEFKYNCLMYDKKKPDTLRFDEAPDFDTAREPIPGTMFSVDTSTGKIIKRYSSQIWHHKWLWVKEDYKGFDVKESYEWSKKWLEKISSPSGYLDKWKAELKAVGLE